jgi:ElaB/YqjD/DUF883 family membrane-anchored ribosome-binding protein
MKIRQQTMPAADGQSPLLDTNSSGKSNGADALACLQREFNTFIADIESFSQQTLSLSGEELSGLRNRLTQRVKQAKTFAEESVAAAGDSLQQHTHKTITAASHYVRDRPWQSVAIGAALGVALGLLVVYRKSLAVKF